MASPDVVEEFSSADDCCGKESEGCGDIDDFLLDDEEELRLNFEQAAQHAQKLAHVATTEQLLYLYARYKQVKVGRCTTSKPGFFDFEGKQKWEAWKALGSCTRQQAMQEYIGTVKKLDPDWSPKPPDENLEDQPRTTFGGPVVSCLYHVQEALRDEDKDIFDYCRDNDVAQVTNALKSGDIDVNVVDEEGRGLLHWACDRGRTELVSVLLFHNAHINMQDSEGQTPLHYASACEYPDIVDLLLDHGADPSLPDNDGYLPHETTDSQVISNMLRQHNTFGEHDKPPSILICILQDGFNASKMFLSHEIWVSELRCSVVCVPQVLQSKWDLALAKSDIESQGIVSSGNTPESEYVQELLSIQNDIA
ncbi:LOW QUALITY PROTEIN: acyl-CoA-binding domain-containing protein 6 [Pelodytes ibericus]